MYQRLKNSLLSPKEIAKYAYDKFYVIVLYMLIFVLLLSVPGIAELKRFGSNMTALFSDNVIIDQDIQYYIKDKTLVDNTLDKSSPTYYFSFKNGSELSGMLLVIGENVDIKKLGIAPMIFQCASDGIYLGLPNGKDVTTLKIMDYPETEIDLSLLDDNDINTHTNFFGMIKTYISKNMGTVYGMGIPGILIGCFIEILSNVFVFALIGYMFNKKLGLKFGKSMKLGIFCSLPMVLGTLFESALGSGFIGVSLYYIGFFTTIVFYVISSRWHLIELHTRQDINNEFTEKEDNDNESI